MALLRCNDPDVTGYSVFCQDSPLYIHAHSEGENLSFYDHPTHTHGIWLYMPLHHGEFLVDIWIRHGRVLPGISLVVSDSIFSQIIHHLIPRKFRTNRGRIMTAGSYLFYHHHGMEHEGGGYSWKHLQTLENAPSRLFFQYSSSISKLGVETPPPVLPKNAIGLSPFSPPPITISFQSYFFSRASLEDVVEVTPCCMETAGVSAIIGLLLRYTDGHQWPVGEIRLDLLQDGIQVNPSEKMTLGFAVAHGLPYVANIRHLRVDRGQSDRSQLILLDIHWTGYLEWWFSLQQCKVYHNGRASPVTRT